MPDSTSGSSSGFEQQIVYAPGSASASQVAKERRASQGLPHDLLEKARSRLSIVALLYIFLFLCAYIVTAIVDLEILFPPGKVPLGVVAAGASWLLAMMLAVAARGRRIDSDMVLHLGLWFQVLGALAITVAENAQPRPLSHPPRGISWVTFWITLFPIFIPVTPWRALRYAVTAAAMGPVGFMLTVWINGNPMVPINHFVLMFFSNFVAAAWAFIAARFLFKLGRYLSEARRLGSYELVEHLGTGGMGEVWRARHRRLIRPAAVKLIRPTRVSGDLNVRTMRRRFEREAQATAVLGSPHTVVLYDFGVTEQGVFYYAMELLDGLDLETLVERFGPQPPERVVHLLIQVCHSLQDAHDNGLIHRDVKPANIFTCQKGGEFDYVKVLDFGLVKTSSPHLDSGQTKLTGDDSASGTPAYMAPEMVTGETEVDGRTDIYSLGCVAYWLLTGQLVFESESSVRLLLKHVQEEPPLVSDHTELDVPAGLEDAVMSCLAKEPDDRPQSPEELADLLRQVTFPRPWTRERSRRWWEVHAPTVKSASGSQSGVDAIGPTVEQPRSTL